MMNLILYIIFLVPLVCYLNSYYMFVVSLIIMFFLLMYYNMGIFFSSVSYFMGMDFISWGFVILTNWIIMLMILSSYKVSFTNKSKEFVFMNFFLLLFLFFSFMSSSFFMYYIFFEASLIPTLFLIFGWGYQPERLTAGFYFIFYTLFASLPLLLGIFYMLSEEGSSFYWLIGFGSNFYIFLSFVLAFLIKMPLFMFHLWLPKAHVEAPISGSMILAGILLKLGGYGLIRVSLFLYNYFYLYGFYIISLSLLGSFICGLICCVQLDMKVLVAYSSVCHMALSIMGIYSMTWFGVMGSFILMLAHGLCSSGLFCLVNIIYERSGSRSILLNKGYLIFMPSMCLFWFLLCSNNMGSPLSLNLFGEIMLIISLMGWSLSCILFLMFSSFLACVYSMYLFSFVNHGMSSNFFNFISSCLNREYMLIFYHLVPLNIFYLKFVIFLKLI
uniref:NADH-ubiquinone oxidoreductase chain 4 n=1 Tax=Eteoneus sigillatus TaxID=1964414 RepID=A0A343BT73_9HEMI|nr:NADH dehydrogenase subunit 4 [Eteoneus sigillatus]